MESVSDNNDQEHDERHQAAATTCSSTMTQDEKERVATTTPRTEEFKKDDDDKASADAPLLSLSSNSSSSPSRLLFGSCTSQHYEQPLWPVILSRKAAAFVWGGDAVYGDDRVHWISRCFHRAGTKEDHSNCNECCCSSSSSSWWWQWQSWIPKQRVILPATPSYLKELYQQQKQLVPGYKAVLESGMTIFGTWDDHDYGVNNGDNTFEWKQDNAMAFVHDFLGLQPEDSAMARRAAQGQGVYGVQVYDFSRPVGGQLLSEEEAGLDPDVVDVVVRTEATDDEQQEGEPEKVQTTTIKNQRVAVFVVDVRTHRTPWPNRTVSSFLGGGPGNEVERGDFLGETQWKWLEEALSRTTAAVNVVVTGLQVHSDYLVPGDKVETWSQCPKSQHRLHQALLQDNVQAPILVTGDVHFAQLARKDCRRRTSLSSSHLENLGFVRPLLEVTTSGMTHSWGSGKNVCARNHLSRLCRMTYYQRMYGVIMEFFQWITPRTEVLEDSSGSEEEDRLDGTSHQSHNNKKKRLYSLDLNFAELDFDWDQDLLTVRILGSSNDVGTPLMLLPSQQWYFSELSGQSLMRKESSSRVTLRDYHKLDQELTARNIILPLPPDNHYGTTTTTSKSNIGNDWLCVNYRGPTPKLGFAFGLVATAFFAFATFSLPPALLAITVLYGCKRCVCRRRMIADL
jgi:hypothetical protein